MRDKRVRAAHLGQGLRRRRAQHRLLQRTSLRPAWLISEGGKKRKESINERAVCQVCHTVRVYKYMGKARRGCWHRSDPRCTFSYGLKSLTRPLPMDSSSHSLRSLVASRNKTVSFEHTRGGDCSSKCEYEYRGHTRSRSAAARTDPSPPLPSSSSSSESESSKRLPWSCFADAATAALFSARAACDR